MRHRGRRTFFLLFTALFALGCGISRRPYAHDPLLRNGSGTWGDPVRNRFADNPRIPEPEAPQPPKALDTNPLGRGITKRDSDIISR